MQPTFVLVHSLALGPSTWEPVAEHLRAAGRQALVPSLLRVGVGPPPYWPRAVGAVRAAVDRLPPGDPLVLVAHSNAGLLLPAIRAGLDHPVTGSVFVDAALPSRTGPTPAGSPQRLEVLRRMAVDGVLPRWTDWWDEEDVAALFPDPQTRQKVVAEQPALPLAYYEQQIPVPDGWDDHRCTYLRFSSHYEAAAVEAHDRGWPVVHLPGTHLQQLADPAGVALLLAESAA